MNNKKSTQQRYYERHRDLIMYKASIKVNCPHCGLLLRTSSLSKHVTTKYCTKIQNRNNHLYLNEITTVSTLFDGDYDLME